MKRPAGADIEAPRPLDESGLYRLQAAYFAACGSAAWTEGHVPSLGTSSYPVARRHARLALAVAQRARSRGELVVLELGAGSGVFALNFCRALETGLGARGRELARRVRFVLSDGSRRTVEDAVAREPLRRLASAGRVVPAIFELERPERLLGLDGRTLDVEPRLVFANYVACVSRSKVLRATPGGWFEKRVGIAARDPTLAGELRRVLKGGAWRRPLLAGLTLESDWAPFDLGSLPPAAGRALVAASRGLPLATIPYPLTFLAAVSKLIEVRASRALVVVSDFGTSERGQLRGAAPCEPLAYVDSLNHPVSFAFVELFFRELGLSVVRTRNALRSIHCAVTAREEVLGPLARSTRAILRDEAGEDYIDFRAAARSAETAGDPRQAAAFYRRCVSLDPGSSEALVDLARTSLGQGAAELALEALRRARRLGVREGGDLELLAGDASVALQRFADAARFYRRALAAGDRRGLARLALLREQEASRRSAWQRRDSSEREGGPARGR